MRSAADLGLGMTVEVESGDIVSAGGRLEATATAVRYTSEIVGPIAAVDTVTRRLTVLGQTVQIDAGTVFGAPLAGIGSLAVGAIVELHAELNAASGLYRATRVDARADADTPAWRIRGLIASRNVLTQRFRIGSCRCSCTPRGRPRAPHALSSLCTSSGVVAASYLRISLAR